MSRYKPYPQYKDSRVEWLGEVPDGWGIAKIKHSFYLGRGRVIAQEEMEDDGLFPVYSSQTKNNGIMGYISTYDFDCKQITWTTDGANAGTVFLREGQHNCTNVCGTLQPKNNNENLEYITYSLQYATQFYKRPDTNGAKIMNGEMAEIFFTFPSPKEQQAIAHFLDNATCKIDTLIQKQQNLIELLKEKRQALISHTVTKGLNLHVKMKDSGVEWLGEIPEHWEVKRLKFVSSYKNSNIDKKSYENQKQVRLCNYTDVYYSENITNDIEFMIATASDSEINAMSLKKGDIIITKDSENPADIGIPAIVIEELDNTVCGYHLTVIEANYDMDSFYLYRTIQSSNTKAYLHAETPGITRYGLKQDTIGSILVVCPPYSEQQTIANYLDSAICKIDTLISKAQKAIELFKERRTALISAIVTGKIDVRSANE